MTVEACVVADETTLHLQTRSSAVAEAARCFVSLNISLSHSRSLKVISYDLLNLGYGLFKLLENGTIGNLGHGFLFNFHINYGLIFSRFDTTDRHRTTI